MNRSSSKLILTIAIASLACGVALADVKTTFSKGKLKLSGDATDNLIEIEGSDLGAVALLINGSSGGEFSGVRDIEVKCGAGKDQLNVTSLQIGGSLRAKLGAGDDGFSLSAFASPTLRPVFIGGNLDLTFGGQNGDSIAVETNSNATVNVMGNVTIRGAATVQLDGGGINPSLEGKDILIGGKLRIDRDAETTSAIDVDVYFLDDVVVGGETKLVLSATKDLVLITDSQFARKATFDLRGADDTVDFQSDASKFDGPCEIHGGGGVDTLLNTNGCEFVDDLALKQVEVAP